MSKAKVYEHDYEWSGQENESKGVNINEKNPWNKPEWGIQPKKDHSGSQSSYANQPDRFGMEELQRRHQWEKPDWATLQKGSGPNNNNNKTDIIKDSIPKPMLKKTAAGVASGIQGASSTATLAGKSKKNIADDADKEIAEMEQRIEEARKKKAALEKQKLDEEEAAEAERLKHTVEESKLERARRLAKEREEVRWRATLAERNIRDKEQRELARRVAAMNNKSSAVSSDAVWEKTQQEQQVRYQERVQKEAMKRQKEEEMLVAQQQHYLDEKIHEVQEAEMFTKADQIEISYPEQSTDAITGVTASCQVDDETDYEEEEEEEIIEEYTEQTTEEYEDEDHIHASADGNNRESKVDAIQRQIDALRKQLEQA